MQVKEAIIWQKKNKAVGVETAGVAKETTWHMWREWQNVLINTKRPEKQLKWVTAEFVLLWRKIFFAESSQVKSSFKELNLSLPESAIKISHCRGKDKGFTWGLQKSGLDFTRKPFKKSAHLRNKRHWTDETNISLIRESWQCYQSIDRV